LPGARAAPLARGVPALLAGEPRPARALPPARAEGQALRADAHPAHAGERRAPPRPRRARGLRRRGRALVGQPGGADGRRRLARGSRGRPAAAGGRAALHRPRSLTALAQRGARDRLTVYGLARSVLGCAPGPGSVVLSPPRDSPAMRASMSRCADARAACAAWGASGRPPPGPPPPPVSTEGP